MTLLKIKLLAYNKKKEKTMINNRLESLYSVTLIQYFLFNILAIIILNPVFLPMFRKLMPQIIGCTLLIKTRNLIYSAYFLCNLFYSFIFCKSKVMALLFKKFNQKNK